MLFRYTCFLPEPASLTHSRRRSTPTCDDHMLYPRVPWQEEGRGARAGVGRLLLSPTQVTRIGFPAEPLGAVGSVASFCGGEADHWLLNPFMEISDAPAPTARAKRKGKGMMSISTKPCVQPLSRSPLMWVSLLQASLLTRLTTSAVIDITSYGAVASNKTAYLVKTDGLIATPHTTSPLLPLVLSILSMLSRTNLRFPARFGMANGVGAGLRG